MHRQPHMYDSACSRQRVPLSAPGSFGLALMFFRFLETRRHANLWAPKVGAPAVIAPEMGIHSSPADWRDVVR